MASPDTYRKVKDSRGRRVRGMWQRHGRYFANLTVEDDLGRKSSQMVALAGGTLEDAKADYARLLTERDDGRLRPMGLVPKLDDFAEVHQQRLAASGKRPASVQKEVSYLRRWRRQLGHLRLNKVRPAHLSQVLTDLAKGTGGEQPLSNRTINLYLIAVRGLFKAALKDGHVKPPLPYEGIEWRRVEHRSRELVTASEIDQLCGVALQATKNGQQLVDYLRLMQFSGARRNEALAVRWSDVDFARGLLTIGATGDTKNREARHVDLNPALEAHLKDMASRRQPDSQWVFPSPQRGDKDIPAKTLVVSLRLTRAAAGVVCRRCGLMVVGSAASCPACRARKLEARSPLLPAKLQRFGFHDLRHHYISHAVMAGIDFMTVARWVGHRDGGILIGKVYGHIANEHRRRQAAKLTFKAA